MLVHRRKIFTILFLFILLFPSTGLVAQQRMSLQQYIETWSPVAMEEMRQFRIPASIKLAQGILESGFGNSELAVHANNHFGIKCHGWQGRTFHKDDDEKDECFRAYRNAAESFRDHSLFLTSRAHYAPLFELEITDYKAWARGLRRAGYATNPRYPDLLIRIIEQNDLTRFDRMALQMTADGATPMQRSTQKQAPTRHASDEIFPVPLDGPRQELTNNRIRYVRARPGDTPASVARELGMREWQIKRYNDLEEGRQIQPGQILYLQPKRRRGAFSEHVVQGSESMYDISQQYGIRLEQLYRRNNMEPGQQPRQGQTIVLRGRAR